MPFFFRRGSTSASRLYHTRPTQRIGAAVSKTAYLGSNPRPRANSSNQAAATRLFSYHAAGGGNAGIDRAWRATRLDYARAGGTARKESE